MHLWVHAFFCAYQHGISSMMLFAILIRYTEKTDTLTHHQIEQSAFHVDHFTHGFIGGVLFDFF